MTLFTYTVAKEEIQDKSAYELKNKSASCGLTYLRCSTEIHMGYSYFILFKVLSNLPEESLCMIKKSYHLLEWVVKRRF